MVPRFPHGSLRGTGEPGNHHCSQLPERVATPNPREPSIEGKLSPPLDGDFRPTSTSGSNASSTRTPRRAVGGARWRPPGAPPACLRGSVRGDGRPPEPTPFQGRPEGEGGPPPPRAGWRGGGPPPPRASRRGGGPPGEGGLAGVDPQALGPRNRSPGGAPGGLPRGGGPGSPVSPDVQREGGFVRGEVPVRS